MKRQDPKILRDISLLTELFLAKSELEGMDAECQPSYYFGVKDYVEKLTQEILSRMGGNTPKNQSLLFSLVDPVVESLNDMVETPEIRELRELLTVQIMEQISNTRNAAVLQTT